MYAIGLKEYGGPEVMEVVDMPTPEPKPDEVRIKTHHAGINPVDIMVRDGLLADWYKDMERPFVPGMDVSGVIDAIGADVDPKWLNQAVVAVVDNAGNYGAYSEYVCVPVASIAKKPANTSFAEAAAFLMNTLTAQNALDVLNLPKGSALLVTGAAGAVGEYAVSLASQQGLTVVAQASETDKEALIKAGASHFISRNEDLTQAVRNAIPEGVDAVIDAAGILDAAVPSIKDNGVLIVLRPADDETLERGITSTFVNVRDRVKDTEVINQLVAKVAEGKLSTQVAAAYPPQQAVQAHQKMAEKGLRGRVVFSLEN